MTFNPFAISEVFQKFYSNLASKLLDKLLAAVNKFGLHSIQVYYKNVLDLQENRFIFQKIKSSPVLKLLKNVKVNEAADMGNISGRFLKDGADITAIPVTQICNLSIKLSHFPNNCKLAKLKPLYKKGSKTDPKNFRPISLLPIVSKIIEKIIHDQTMEYLTDNKILYRYQSGFRKNHSTDTCLSYLTDKILTGFHSGLLSGMILIDLQKALDTINHNILLKKMSSTGFSSQSITLFGSYLSNRRFQVNIKNKYSNVANINCGVPQGSILGPLLFLLYVNNITQAVDCELFLYADGSCLLYQHRDVKEIDTKLNKNFSTVCDWFVNNKLNIHFEEDKTKYILFGTKMRLKQDNDLSIKYGTVHIKQ